MVDWEAMVGLVLMVFPECTAIGVLVDGLLANDAPGLLLCLFVSDPLAVKLL